MAETIEKIISHFETFLRFAASGFVVLLCIILGGFDQAWMQNMPAWEVLISFTLIGITIYSLNSNIIGHVILWWLIVSHFSIFHARKNNFSNARSELRDKLDMQRWLRRGSDDFKAKAVQNELNRWGAMLNYLYCSSYPVITVAVIKWHKNEDFLVSVNK